MLANFLFAEDRGQSGARPPCQSHRSRHARNSRLMANTTRDGTSIEEASMIDLNGKELADAPSKMTAVQNCSYSRDRDCRR